MFGFVAMFSILPGFLYVTILGGAGSLMENSPYLWYCALGFSGEIFAFLVIDSATSPATERNFCGLFKAPGWSYPWILLVMVSIFIPNSSFYGHLAGVLSASMYVKGLIGPLTPSRSWILSLEQLPIVQRMSGTDTADLWIANFCIMLVATSYVGTFCLYHALLHSSGHPNYVPCPQRNPLIEFSGLPNGSSSQPSTISSVQSYLTSLVGRFRLAAPSSSPATSSPSTHFTPSTSSRFPGKGYVLGGATEATEISLVPSESSKTVNSKLNIENPNKQAASTVSWSCTRCTYNNSPSSTQCDVCEERRPAHSTTHTKDIVATDYRAEDV